MLCVLLLDFIAAGVFHSWIFLAPAVLLAGAIAFLVGRLFKAKETTAQGWELGPALEITNPDRPVKVKNAVIDRKIIKLGMLSKGAPGAGKTESVALGYLHALPRYEPKAGWMYFEGKGDTDIYRKCVAMGAAPDNFFSTELPGSDSINLFVGSAHDVIDRLGHSLIGTTSSTSFYSDSQRAVLLKIVPLLKALPLPTNLRDLYAVLSIEDAGAALLNDARKAGVKSSDIQLARQWLEIPFADRLREISGLLNRLYIFCNGPNSMRLNAYQPDIDISEAIERGKKIYLHLPLTGFARDVAIAIIEMVHVEARKRQLAGTENANLHPLLFDDWGAFFHENFGPFSARCRSAAMPLSFGFQSRAQLESVSKQFADELDDTIATKIILRIQGDETAAYAQRLLGAYEKHRFSETTRDGASMKSTSISTQDASRIDARTLRELRAGEAFISTLEPGADGQMKSPLWKLRLPLPDFSGWQDIPMPAAKEHQEGDGLRYWERFVDEVHLDELMERIRDQEENETAQVAGDLEAAVDALASNPGFGAIQI